MSASKPIANFVLIFTGGYGFPIGDAYTNRILAFARGFVDNGCKVTLLIIYPGRNNQAEVRGRMDGFEYIFCAGLKRPDNWLLRKLVGIKGIVNMVREIMHIHRSIPVDGILTFSQNFSQNFPVYLWSRISKTVFVRENNEFPRKVLRRGHSRLNWFDRLFFSFVNRFYDGLIYISSTLVDFNKPLLRISMPVEVVPIIVDTNRFVVPDTDRKPWITYCGNLFGEKDGVTILIEAFSLIHQSFTDFKLVLIGNTSNATEFGKLKHRTEELGIAEKVVFTGFVHRNEIPGLLQKSSLLVLARPDNIQAKGGFPTKLGEYLATGRPVLVTATSDIPRYICHGINGYLAQPGSANDFAEKMKTILSDYTAAEQVGLEGKKLTETHFNNSWQSRRIIHFINQLKKIRK
jgi:glycosyltransferase involved in cell wall biosynthesis